MSGGGVIHFLALKIYGISDYLTIILAMPIDIDLFSGSTNLKIHATHGIADIQVNQIVTNRHDMNAIFCQ